MSDAMVPRLSDVGVNCPPALDDETTVTIVLPGAGVARVHAPAVKQRVAERRAPVPSKLVAFKPKPRRSLLLPLVLILLPVAMVALAGPALWGRAFWLDECLTYLVASDPSLEHSLAALAGGVDTNPPAVHLLLRALGAMIGHTPLAYRAAMTACFVVAAWGLHAIISRRVPTGSSALLSLLVFVSMPLVLHHATDARFYAPMLAFCVIAALLLDRRSTRRGVLSAFALAVVSAALVLTHYFGSIALACLVFGALLASRERWLARVGQVVPAIAGFALLFAVRPLLAAQRDALASAGGTWMSVGLEERLTTALQQLLPILPAVPVLVAIVLAIPRLGSRHLLGSIGSLGGLLLMPFAVLAFDLFVQPVFVARYLLPALLPLAAIAGVSVASLSPRLRIAIGLLLVTSFATTMLQKRAALTTQLDPRSTTALLLAIDDQPRLPVLSDWRGYALPLSLARPHRDIRFIPLVPGDIPDSLRGSVPFEALMAQIDATHYGVPRIVSTSSPTPDEFLFVTEFPESVRATFAHRRVTAVTPVVFLVGPATPTPRGQPATTRAAHRSVAPMAVPSTRSSDR